MTLTLGSFVRLGPNVGRSQPGFLSILEPRTRSASPLPTWEQSILVLTEGNSSVEHTCRQVRRSPAIRQQAFSIRCLFLIQVGKYLLNYCRVFNTGKNPNITSAFITGFNLNARKHASAALPRSSKPLLLQGFGLPHPPCGTFYVCLVWQVLPVPDTCCWVRRHREIGSD